MISISKDTANNTMHIVREFNAPRQKVWSAWTERDKLDKWWGPKPWHVQTKFMDFKEGGCWFYAMVGPEGERHWSLCTYTNIDVPNGYKHTCNFSDESGSPLPGFASSYWLVQMSGNNGVTVVNLTITFDNAAGLEQLVKTGFEKGITMIMDQLDELLG